MSRNVHALDSKQSAAFRVWQSLACLLNCRHMYFPTGFFCVVLFRFFSPKFESCWKWHQEIPTVCCHENDFHVIRFKFIYTTTESKTEWRRGWSICYCHSCKPYPNFCVDVLLSILRLVLKCSFLIRCSASLLSNGPAGRMLGTARPTQNSAGTLSSLQRQNTHLKSGCLQYQLYRLLNSHCFCLLKNGMGPIIFFLCAYVPKTEAGRCKWAAVLEDLERIKTSKDIDVSLYTANADEDLSQCISADIQMYLNSKKRCPEECQELVMRCFFLETAVIIQECHIKNCSKTQDVWNIWKNGNESFEKNKLTSTKSEKCKECEEYEEKNFAEFVQNFVKVIQRDCKH
ncbi:PREDICTED: interleukin-15 isoform X3 [Corvus brachyrhynchos]|uniref:interleukin-15 isoform X3 n=1 Tax=Corvus brachyrhynchos TaxID=85066 RepID=UPI000816607D|nr:PREDICTED: interleukin-15 isoform X3 [Corvus brachyrhynchos]